jgi:hypothetical protein
MNLYLSSESIILDSFSEATKFGIAKQHTAHEENALRMAYTQWR